jgi:diadenosine tetraphosphate (Ap4A) HIT family hydrolase
VKINERIEADSEYLCDLPLSQARLIKDGELDWFLLIPRVEDAIEWIDLNEEAQIILTKEISLISNLIKENCRPDKINIASLGNIVPQLHIHVLARYKNDRAWPAPIWGTQSENGFDSNKVDYWKKIIQSTELG